MKTYANPADWLEKNYFNAEGWCYSVLGGDTYPIKEDLKELGFKWHPIFQWHQANPIDNALPAPYKIQPFYYADYLTWSNTEKTMIPKLNAEILINRVFAGPSSSEYLDEDIGTRIRDRRVTLQSKKGFSTRYGWSTLLTFAENDNIITWFTATDQDDLQEGGTYFITGTIKDKEEYKGVKTTKLSRCIVKEEL